jgi:hypothetical protein
VLESKVLWRIFGPKRDEVTGEWRKLHNEELRDLLIKYWNTSVRNTFFGARFIVHFTLHVSVPIGGHLQVVYKHIKIYSR